MKQIDLKELDKFIEESLQEDVGPGDYTSESTIPATNRDSARLIVKDDGIICGVEIAKYIFKTIDPSSSFEELIPDGSEVKHGDIAFIVEMNSRLLLRAERLVLNTMQRLSGISTLSNRFAFEVEDLSVKILDTRKTTPRLRFLEKFAVRNGGCYNYRDGLYDWIMIKDNHIDACGSVGQAIKNVLEFFDKNKMRLGITVEVRNLVELHQVLEVGGVTRIMLDNFELAIMEEAVKTINGEYEVEASGNVTLATVRNIAKTGVDYISSGALTHSAGQLDLSLKVIKD
ncbi:carboxylating nicotinate-nucleotide diphosphorylase [Saprospiraceae bacterium]|nr:carboxylating nicotinate-nucleotide diphosphorylase [Saprospiraceae bacterium]